MWRNFLGLNTQPLWFTPKQYTAQFTALKALGLNWVRIGLHWSAMTRPDGRFRYGRLDALVHTLKRLDLHSDIYLVGSARFDSSGPIEASNFDQYPPREDRLYVQQLAALARRYPSVNAWEVWNKENLPAFWRGDTKAYARLLVDAGRALAAEGAQSKLVVGGFAFYSQIPAQGHTLMLEQLWRLGVLRPPMIVAFHPYNAAACHRHLASVGERVGLVQLSRSGSPVGAFFMFFHSLEHALCSRVL
ncbi:hypothetical protein BJI67_15940 (plasmid) [Acidihalobacter aeolianus]|uniref:Glycoside hydrolase family 5 domain-containing protein n=1 Tax=Acidihalobacter aeolianus TaxID=2792603 RepID=A0A1D8KCQ4_9GAMM|nr:hypothetical protein [Acidihalobacter aeolianus]AOV18733.1 hypothetical protein BJI67_15940 [Acidihalobacter aeolianus]